MISKKKKKKGSSPKLRVIFRPISQIQTFEGGCFRMGGGLFSIFHRKSASKTQKTCDFAYFTSQWGGSSPPALLATLLGVAKILIGGREQTTNHIGKDQKKVFTIRFRIFDCGGPKFSWRRIQD